MIRDPTTESVYLDFVQNEYARELREFPEEVVDWTVSDFYTEILNKFEISELPISTNESELYSIDSSNSISDFFLGVGHNSNLGEHTLHISNEPSSEYSDLIFENYKKAKRFRFNLFNKVNKIHHFEANVSPNAHPEVDLFGSPNFLGSRAGNRFDDFFEKSLYDSKKMEEIYLRDWGDSNKMELEDNTREVETIFKQQKYLEAFRVEAIFDELLLQNNLNSNLGFSFSHKHFEPQQLQDPLSYRYVLFTKTNYLKHYRGLMLDIGLERYMF